MAHSGKKVNEVYQTKEYSKFKFRNDNRIINQNHVRSLVKNMKENGWEPGSYVVVNALWEIIDGQHRTLAAIAAGIPINYTMEKKADFDTIRNLNRNQKNWLMNDHIHGFVAENNVHYVRLQNFMKQYPEFKITEAMMFCKNANVSIPRGTFESGQFTTKDMGKAALWASYLIRLKPFCKFFNRGIFVRAVITCLGNSKFDFEEFFHKVELRPTMLVPCGTREQFIELIEDIYNYRRSQKINLRFKG